MQLILNSSTCWIFPPLTIIEHEGEAYRKVNIKSQPKNIIGKPRHFHLNDCTARREIRQQSPAEMFLFIRISTGAMVWVLLHHPQNSACFSILKKNTKPPLIFKVSVNLGDLCLINLFNSTIVFATI